MVQRNYRVVGLKGEDDEGAIPEVLIKVDGRDEPTETGLAADEFVDVDQLEEGGVFSYYRLRERRILKRGARLARRRRKKRGRRCRGSTST